MFVAILSSRMLLAALVTICMYPLSTPTMSLNSIVNMSPLSKYFRCPQVYIMYTHLPPSSFHCLHVSTVLKYTSCTPIYHAQASPVHRYALCMSLGFTCPGYFAGRSLGAFFCPTRLLEPHTLFTLITIMISFWFSISTNKLAA